jgi:hypothetical protein
MCRAVAPDARQVAGELRPKGSAETHDHVGSTGSALARAAPRRGRLSGAAAGSRLWSALRCKASPECIHEVDDVLA